MAGESAEHEENRGRRARREQRRLAALEAERDARILRAQRRALQVDAAIVAGAARSEVPAQRGDSGMTEVVEESSSAEASSH